MEMTPPAVDRRDNLSQAKCALLEQRLRRRDQQQPTEVKTRPIDAPSDAKFAQEHLRFFTQLNPSSAAYNMHLYMCIQGPLDSAWLARSISLPQMALHLAKPCAAPNAGGDTPSVFAERARKGWGGVHLTPLTEGAVRLTYLDSYEIGSE